MEHVLEVRGLVHRYGGHTALTGVDLTVVGVEEIADRLVTSQERRVAGTS